MRAALLSGYHRPLELVERPDPEPVAPRDVVVRVAGAGVCATDLHAIDGEMEPAGLRLPVVLGHENAGYVHAVGPDVQSAKVGDPVLVYPAYSCGLCVSCRRGLDMHCAHHAFTGLSRDGGFADYVLVDERSLVPLPPGIDPVSIAPHSDAGITAYHAVKKLLPQLAPGSTAVLIGTGGVGHIALQLIHALGGARVIAVDVDERRRRLAHELGADEVIEGGEGVVDRVREATNGTGADVVLDFVGRDATHTDGIAMLARRGTYTPVGFGGTISWPSAALVGTETSVVSTLVGSWVDLWELVQLQASGRITLKTETHALESVNDVLDSLRAGDVTGRAVLVP